MVGLVVVMVGQTSRQGISPAADTLASQVIQLSRLVGRPAIEAQPFSIGPWRRPRQRRRPN